jgi:hypothetical protein
MMDVVNGTDPHMKLLPNIILSPAIPITVLFDSTLTFLKTTGAYPKAAHFRPIHLNLKGCEKGSMKIIPIDFVALLQHVIKPFTTTALLKAAIQSCIGRRSGAPKDCPLSAVDRLSDKIRRYR